MQMRTADLAQLVGLEGALPLKRDFREKYELRAYLRAVLVAKRLLESPELIQRGRAYLERFVRPDPRQRLIYELWTNALQLGVEELVADLLADDARGAALRESAPVFVTIAPEEVRGLVRLAA